MFQPYDVVNIVVSMYLVLIAIYGLYHSGIVSRAKVEDVYAKSLTFCSKTDRKYSVVGGDTLARIATHYGLTEHMVTAYNHLTGQGELYTGQSLCIQGTASGSAFNNRLRSLKALASVTERMHLVKPAPHQEHKRRDRSAGPLSTLRPEGTNDGYAAFRDSLAPFAGFVNVFSYGQCTWWAAQRYFQLHSVVVPWRSQANAEQWTARAYENGWTVSSEPHQGSIIVLQPGVQGASGLGHVGIVEQVLEDNTVIVSSMNWGYGYGGVSLDLFRPGLGVTFLEQ
jgi:LysM repeat protein